MRYGMLAGLASLGGVLVLACSKDPPPPMPPQTPPPAVTAAPPPTARPSAAVPGELASPGPTALSCQADAQCLGHRCNLPAGRCAFPCAADSDCVAGATCFLGGGPAAFCIATKAR